MTPHTPDTRPRDEQEPRPDSWVDSVVPHGGLAYGADYNPEQWDRRTWREDVELMGRAGVNLVSLGIFSWALLEPRPGEFDFGWLDEVLDMLGEAGIRVDLATPTAATPHWLYRAHPEARVVEADGRVRAPGSRGIPCPHSPAYWQASERITRAVAAHAAQRPEVAMWHVHNEYGMPSAACHCPVSQQAFRDWLERRHGSLAGLNEAWGTAFWGQRYTDWQEVTTPMRSGTVVNPAAELDFARFTSQSLLDHLRREKAIIAEHTPGLPVTTNFMASSGQEVDYWRWVDDLDVVSTDYYLQGTDPMAHVGAALESDLTRGLAHGRPWMVMEHSTSAVSWQPHNIAKDPDEERRTVLCHVARGADGVLAFQWRASRRGAEKFHSAMVPHAGPDSRVFREVCRGGEDMARLGAVRGSRVRSRVGLVWDWESLWAQGLAWRPSELLRPRDQIRTAYEWLWRRGTCVDVIESGARPEGLDVVVVPAGYLLTEEAGQVLTRFVEKGGTLVVLPFSGVVDADECVHPGGAPGPLRAVLGLTVEEFRPVREGEVVHLEGPDGARARARLWSEGLRLEGAEPVWQALDGPTPGPAVTRHRVGRGQAVYVSVGLDAEQLGRVVEAVVEVPVDRPRIDPGRAGGPAGDPTQVEVVTRHGARDHVFVINHDRAEHTVEVAGRDLLTDRRVDPLVVPAGGVAVVEVEGPGRGESVR